MTQTVEAALARFEERLGALERIQARIESKLEQHIEIQCQRRPTLLSLLGVAASVSMFFFALLGAGVGYVLTQIDEDIEQATAMAREHRLRNERDIERLEAWRDKHLQAPMPRVP